MGRSLATASIQLKDQEACADGESRAAQDVGAGPVVLRTSWPRVVTWALATPMGIAVGVGLPFLLSARAGRPGLPVALPASLMAYALAMAGLSIWSQRKNRLVLRGGELTVRSGYRTYHLRAEEIQAVTLERQLGSRVLTLWLSDGGYHRAGVAGRTEGLVRQNFDRDFHLVGDWWLANHGQHRQPNPVTRQGAVPRDFDWNPGSWAQQPTGDA